MHKLLFVFLILFISISLEAYAKRIIFISLSTQERADAMMKKLPASHPSLFALAKKHDFQIKLKDSGKYYILVAEVFTDEEVLNTALKEIRKSFKGAYASSYKYPKKEVKKLIPEVKAVIPEVKREALKPTVEIVQKPKQVFVQKEVEIQKVLEIKKQPEIKIESIKEVVKKVEKVIVPKTVEKKEEKKEETTQTFLEKYFEWTYVILLILGLVIIRYYIKFKRIYDEY